MTVCLYSIKHSPQHIQSPTDGIFVIFIYKDFYKHVPWTGDFPSRHLSYKNDRNWAQRFMYVDTHHNIIYNGEKLETETSTNREVN